VRDVPPVQRDQVLDRQAGNEEYPAKLASAAGAKALPDLFAAEPSSYTVQYWNGSTWVEAAGQVRTPGTPRANYNVDRFTPVSTARIRIQFTHAPGFRTGLTEVKVHNRGVPN
jgi:hypothetical protein